MGSNSAANLLPFTSHQHLRSSKTGSGMLRLLFTTAVVLWAGLFFLIYNGLYWQERLGDAGDPNSYRRCEELASELREEVGRLQQMNRELSAQVQRLETEMEAEAKADMARLEGNATSKNEESMVEEERKRHMHHRSLQRLSFKEKSKSAAAAAERDQAMSEEAAKMGAGEAAALISQHYTSMESEVRRRRLHNQILELFYTLRGKAPSSNSTSNSATIRRVGDDSRDKSNNANSEDRSAMSARSEDPILEQMLSLIADSENYGKGEGDNLAEWHRKELAKLTSHIQDRIYKLQHPSDCSKARILTCELNKGCGFGCQIHHVAYCLTVAAAVNRTMVLVKDGVDWRYSQSGWTAAFLPVTNCTADAHAPGKGAESWTGATQTARVVYLPIVDVLKGRPEQMPLSFPAEMREQLLTHHSNPPAYFAGQFVHYLMKDNEKLAEHLAKLEATIPFADGPVVGLQIRRTDKLIAEASYHSVDEYMRWADYWFRIQQRRRDAQWLRALENSSGKAVDAAAQTRHVIKKLVFVATDDPTAVGELRSKYPDYEFFSNDAAAVTAQLDQRYTDASLMGVLADIRLLSRCTHLVCTFSSQVCRVAYELMQVDRGDRAEAAHSLDDIYYYGGQSGHEQTMVELHYAGSSPPGQMDAQPGDVIGIAGNHWDGWSKGQNRRTGKTGLYPSYKAVERWRVVPFPLFNLDHIPLNS